MRQLLRPGWLACHALLVAAVVTMLWLGWWQLSRATAGNALSWGYALQWPTFAGFAVFVWAREVRRVVSEPRRPELVSEPRRPVITRPPDDQLHQPDTDDADLAAYNRYLAWLSANPGARPVDYPG